MRKRSLNLNKENTLMPITIRTALTAILLPFLLLCYTSAHSETDPSIATTVNAPEAKEGARPQNSTLPLERIQLPSSEVDPEKQAAFDDKHDKFRRFVIRDLLDEITWNRETFQETRRRLKTLVVKHDKSRSQPHSPFFYESIEQALLETLSQYGFDFHDCIKDCDTSTKINFGNQKLSIKRVNPYDELYEELKQAGRVDGVMKWQFIALGEQGFLSVKMLDTQNVIVWQDTIRVGKLEEAAVEVVPVNDQLRFNFSLKNQPINHFQGTTLVTTIDQHFLMSYGFKGETNYFESLRYYVGSRFQLNAVKLDELVFFQAALDARLGYAFVQDESGYDVLALYTGIIQDFTLAAGTSVSGFLEWNLSKEYYIGIGYEQSLEKKRTWVGENSQSNNFILDDGVWIEVGFGV